MINKLPLPKLLLELTERGAWLHPGDEVLRNAFPLLTKPLDFATSVNGSPILAGLGWPVDSRDWSSLRVYFEGEERPLPCLDARRAVFLAVNRFPGDDVAIALDFRGGLDRPCVVASRWLESGSEWFLIAEDFESFWRRLGSSRD